MSGRGWHILREDGALTLSRRVPPRFDVRVETVLPGGSAMRLAHQIRQDLWRMAQRVRGFAPVVRVTAEGTGWRVTAGGAATGPVAPDLAERIEAMLADPKTRARWLRCAGHRPGDAQ